MKKYKLSDSQIKKIANLAVQENGESAVSEEVSLMANLFELQSKYTDIYSYIRNGGWFSRASYWMDNGSSSASAVAKTKDVLVNGKRTLPPYIDEHDCFSDIQSVSNNGKKFKKTDRTQYKKDVTKIVNVYGSRYTFYCFPSKDSDPFGYTDKAYKKMRGTESTQDTESKVSDPDKLLTVALAEDGYLEKKSNSQLDSKKANAGDKNFTKYWRDMKPSYQGQPWCQCFANWCMRQAFGEADANRLLCGGLYEFYTPDSAQNFKRKGQWFTKNPKKGDLIYFKNSERIHHVGIVRSVTAATVYTIEGNTGNDSQVIANGGAVCKKSYAIGNPRIAGYGRPKYDTTAPSTATTAPTTSTGKKLNETVKFIGKVNVKTKLNVRTWAGVNNPVTSFSPLDPGEEVMVCDTILDDDGNKWYYIKYVDRYGFVLAKYITT